MPNQVLKEGHASSGNLGKLPFLRLPLEFDGTKGNYVTTSPTAAVQQASFLNLTLVLCALCEQQSKNVTQIGTPMAILPVVASMALKSVTMINHGSQVPHMS